MRPEAQERHESTNTTSVADALILEGNGNEANYERNWGLTTLMTEGDVSRFYFCRRPTNFSPSPFSDEGTATMLELHVS